MWNPIVCSTTTSCFNCIDRQTCSKRESFYTNYDPTFDSDLNYGIAFSPEKMEKKKQDELTLNPIYSIYYQW